MFLTGVHTFNVNTFCAFSYRKRENELENECQDHFMISCYYICRITRTGETKRGYRFIDLADNCIEETKGREKCNNCKVCEKGFNKSSDLQKHKSIHTGEKS